MRIEVVYALVEQQCLLTLDMPEQATVEQAIVASGILNRYLEIDLQKNPLGIFSKKVKLYDQLQEGDRIEIYRSLTIDPKTARRIRAAKK